MSHNTTFKSLTRKARMLLAAAGLALTATAAGTTAAHADGPAPTPIVKKVVANKGSFDGGVRMSSVGWGGCGSCGK
jgi:Spy/CpxP family protein refolding chaperone